jgi:hypothetical protein
MKRNVILYFNLVLIMNMDEKTKKKFENLMWDYDHGYFNVQNDVRKKNIVEKRNLKWKN